MMRLRWKKPTMPSSGELQPNKPISPKIIYMQAFCAFWIEGSLKNTENTSHSRSPESAAPELTHTIKEKNKKSFARSTLKKIHQGKIIAFCLSHPLSCPVSDSFFYLTRYLIKLTQILFSLQVFFSIINMLILSTVPLCKLVSPVDQCSFYYNKRIFLFFFGFELRLFISC